MLKNFNLLRQSNSIQGYGFQKNNLSNNRSENPEIATPTTICFFNDVHSRIDSLAGLSNRISDFTMQNQKNTDCFVLAGGDIKSGINEKLNMLMLMWLEKNANLSALGNHDLDRGTAGFSDELSKFTSYSQKILGRKPNFKYISTNLSLADKDFLTHNKYNKTAVYTSEEKENCHDKKILSSCILERNGNKYGFIGTVPNNLELILNSSKPYLPLSSELHVANNHLFNISPEVSAFNNDKTIEALQKEIESLKNQGINRIILLSHSGFLNDLSIAQRTEGIDIIIGGHSHNVKPGYFVKSKVGEPVLIVQAGKNGDLIGFLKTFFDKNGVINPVLTQTSLEKNNFGEQNASLNILWDKIFGPKQVLGYVSTKFNTPSFDRKTQENPLVSFIANSIKYLDLSLSAIKKEKPADAVLLVNNAEYLSAKIEEGQITDRVLESLSKYNKSLYKIELSGQDLKDLLDWGANSIVNSIDFLKTNSPFPGLINTSGISYKVDLLNSPKVKDIIFRNNAGRDNFPIDLNKTYSIIIDDNFVKTAKNYLDQRPYKIISKNFHKPMTWPDNLSQASNRQVSIYDSLYNYIKGFNGQSFNISRDPLNNSNEPSRVVLNNLSNNDACGKVDLWQYKLSINFKGTY